VDDIQPHSGSGKLTSVENRCEEAELLRGIIQEWTDT
jgi:hypothetical protein